MKKLIFAVAVVVACVAGFWLLAHAAEVTSQNVVGYFKMNIPSATRAIIAIPMQKIPLYRGTITANDATTITDSGASWADGQFAEGVTGQEATGASTFYIEISDTNSAFEGRHFYIATNSATVLTIDGGLPTEIGTDALAGKSYKITPAQRIRDVFGEPGSPVLTGGSDVATADTITKWDSVGNTWGAAIHYHTSGPPTDKTGHWLMNDNYADNEIVDRDESLFVKRIGGATNITVTGEVSKNAQAVVVSKTRAFVGGAAVIDQTLPASNLTNMPGFRGGIDVASADTITKWDPVLNTWDAAVHFHTNGPPTDKIGKWLQSDIVIDSSNYFRAGEGYFYKALSNLVWTRESPIATNAP